MDYELIDKIPFYEKILLKNGFFLYPKRGKSGAYKGLEQIKHDENNIKHFSIMNEKLQLVKKSWGVVKKYETIGVFCSDEFLIIDIDNIEKLTSKAYLFFNELVENKTLFNRAETFQVNNETGKTEPVKGYEKRLKIVYRLNEEDKKYLELIKNNSSLNGVELFYKGLCSERKIISLFGYKEIVNNQNYYYQLFLNLDENNKIFNKREMNILNLTNELKTLTNPEISYKINKSNNVFCDNEDKYFEDELNKKISIEYKKILNLKINEKGFYVGNCIFEHKQKNNKKLSLSIKNGYLLKAYCFSSNCLINNKKSSEFQRLRYIINSMNKGKKA